MITDLHILKGLHNVIRKYFPHIEIVDKDDKDRKRPAFYIQDITRRDSNIAPDFFESIKAFNITYFGSDKRTGNIELVRIKEWLSNIFLKPIKIKIKTKNKVKNVFYIEIDSFDVRTNRNENYVSCDLIVNIQQRKINVLIEEAKANEDEIVVDYENNLDSDVVNNELMEVIEQKINKK